ncbi:MAG TPA: hypothetical protein VF310_05680 [Vicinamibacteria bacterium]
MPSAAPSLAAASPVLAERRAASVPWHLEAVLFGSTSIIVGLVWDICWHRTIGRDTFWSPPHLAIYLGGLAAGLASAAAILASLRRGASDAGSGVRVWGLRGPLGAFFCAWGAGAMLTSAPFDDWWHNAYGLDVKILSPPHMVLALGILLIQVGAMITAVSHQNRSEGAGLRARYIYAAGLLLTGSAVFVYEKTIRLLMHHSGFYQVAALVFPFLLLAVARASRLPWAATWTAAVYTALMLAQLWLFPLFPATPRLGPVRNPVDHLVPLQFPMLLVVPALALDLLLRRRGSRPVWPTSLLAGALFVATLLAVQWPFASFLMSPASHNAFFGTLEFPYFVSLESYLKRRFILDSSAAALGLGLALAVGLGTLSARVGLGFGSWMSRVQR